MRDKIAALLIATGKSDYVKYIEMKKDNDWKVNELLNLTIFTNTCLSITDKSTGYELLKITKEDLE